MTRTVEAPPGKLGLSLRVESGGNGPVIQNVKDSSPLVGIVAPGEVLVSIDDVKTRDMSMAEISGKHILTVRNHEQICERMKFLMLVC